MANLLTPLLLTTTLLLAGCQSTAIKPAPVTNWEKFKQHQTELTQWQLNAKLGYQSPQDSGSAWLEWQQQHRFFDVHLSGPFGAGATRLKGDPDHVVMWQPGRQQQVAASSEELTRHLLGLPLPIEALIYWVRGIPDPATNITAQTHNEDGTLLTLEQDSWLLSFSRHSPQGEWILPGKISGQKGELGFKLIIKQWQPLAN